MAKSSKSTAAARWKSHAPTGKLAGMFREHKAKQKAGPTTGVIAEAHAKSAKRRDIQAAVQSDDARKKNQAHDDAAVNSALDDLAKQHARQREFVASNARKKASAARRGKHATNPHLVLAQKKTPKGMLSRWVAKLTDGWHKVTAKKAA